MLYKNMNQMAQDIKILIDRYWKLEITGAELKQQISLIFSYTENRGLAMRGPAFKAGFERKLGKKRIEELTGVLLSIDAQLYDGLVG